MTRAGGCRAVFHVAFRLSQFKRVNSLNRYLCSSNDSMLLRIFRDVRWFCVAKARVNWPLKPNDLDTLAQKIR